MMPLRRSPYLLLLAVAPSLHTRAAAPGGPRCKQRQKLSPAFDNQSQTFFWSQVIPAWPAP